MLIGGTFVAINRDPLVYDFAIQVLLLADPGNPSRDAWAVVEAAGIVAGHIIECGAQASGGNLLADWRDIPDLANVGYPIVNASADGTFEITKHPGTIDLVISDVVMPEMGGRELARRLAEHSPGLPVLFMSGYTGDDVVHRGLLEPGAPFQQKPFTPVGLATKVRAMLDQHAHPHPTSPSQ